MRTGTPLGWPHVSRLSASLLIGTLTMLGLVGCAQQTPLTPSSVPAEAAAATSTSAPESAAATDPTSASHGKAPIPTADIALTLSTLVPKAAVRPDTKSETPVTVTTQLMPTEEIPPKLSPYQPTQFPPNQS